MWLSWIDFGKEFDVLGAFNFLRVVKLCGLIDFGCLTVSLTVLDIYIYIYEEIILYHYMFFSILPNS